MVASGGGRIDLVVAMFLVGDVVGAMAWWSWVGGGCAIVGVKQWCNGVYGQGWPSQGIEEFWGKVKPQRGWRINIEEFGGNKGVKEMSKKAYQTKYKKIIVVSLSFL